MGENRGKSPMHRIVNDNDGDNDDVGGTELFCGATTLHQVWRNHGIQDGRIGSPAGAFEIRHLPNI
jgi:hypothetical protein